MKLRIRSSFLAAGLTAAALLTLLPAAGRGQANAVENPFKWLDKYDSDQLITLTGVVNKVDWSNPHVHFQLDVKDPSGNVIAWQLEGYPPNTLKRGGFPSDVLKLGETVTVTAYKAKDGSNRAAGSEVTFPDSSKKRLGPVDGKAERR